MNWLTSASASSLPIAGTVKKCKCTSGYPPPVHAVRYLCRAAPLTLLSQLTALTRRVGAMDYSTAPLTEPDLRASHPAP
ncbi:MAG: hypothetical protein AAFR90_14640, partial [Pseudomonadota bacterium]